MKKTFPSLVAAAMLAGAQAVASPSASSDSVEVKRLNEVQVVATRANAKTPVAFTNVTAEELRKVNSGLDVPYLLQATPSVVTSSDAGAGMGYTYMRVRGSDASRINVTANGVPINDAESHNLYWVDMPDLASSLKDIQIQRGAGTSTNGAGAFGASINMVTAPPSYQPFAGIDASYGWYNTNKQTLRVGSGLLGDSWIIDARLSHLGTDGYIDRASSKLWSYYGQVGYYHDATSVKLVAFGGKEDTYQAWDYASKEDMEKYGRRYNPCGKYTDSEGKTAFFPDQIDHFVQHNFQLVFNHSLSHELNLNVALHYTRGDGYYEQYKTGRTLVEYGLDPYYLADGTKVKKSDLIRYKHNANDFGGGIFALTYSRGPVEAILGGGVNRFVGDHFGQIGWVRNYVGSIDPLQEYYRNTGYKTDANIYARASIDIYRGLSGYIDLQLRHINYKIKGISDTYNWNIEAMQPLAIHNRYNFFNPKAGLNYAIDKHQRLYASVAVAHKEPTRDNFVDADPDRQPVPERLTDWEAGYSYQNPVFSAGANFYFMGYRDQLVPTGQLSDTGNAVSVNVPKSYRAGIELMLRYMPVKWLDWQFTTTFSRNRIRDFVEYIYEDEWTNPITFDLGDTPIAFSPDLTFHNKFGFNFGSFDASVATRYVSKQYLTNAGNDEASLDAYCVTDLLLGYTLRNVLDIKQVRFGLNIYNILNEKYESNGYAGAGYYVGPDGEKIIYRYAGYAAQAPINLMATVSISF